MYIICNWANKSLLIDIIFMLKEVSAGAIIFKRDNSVKYLLLKPKKESIYWDFPKGNIEKDEDEMRAAQREIREETSLVNLQFFPQFKEKVSYFYRKGKELVSKQVIFFLAEAVNGEVKISWEHVEYGWFEFADAVKKLRENSINILQKAEDFLKNKM